MGEYDYIGEREFTLIKGLNYHQVTVGNDHSVIISNRPKSLISRLQNLSQNVSFTAYGNLETVKIVDKTTLEMYVLERGSGRTLSCGTGACASVITAKQLGLIQGEDFSVFTEGGRLDVSIKEGKLYLSGGSKRIFSGEYII